MISGDYQEEEQFLRRFEPVCRYTRGEVFFPMDVEPYIRACSLWSQNPGSDAACVIPQGELTLENLTQPRASRLDTVYFLRFIEPLEIRRLITYLRQQRKTSDPNSLFRVGYGRLARVGYSSRFADLLFSLSLLLRGRVPGDSSAAAALEYQRIMNPGEHYCYYGRVVEQNGWTVLQYWFFYAFNNWRSAFFGVNDHEGDWESVNIYLYKTQDGEYVPEWVAYSSHDYSGDDLRRRWDDPELHKEGMHPVVYAGAGSHAGYFSAGEYLAEIEMPFLIPISRLINRLSIAWNQMPWRDPTAQAVDRSEFGIFRVPFVDFARGDGLSIGPGQQKEWSCTSLLNPLPDWVSKYRGLWGLFARDPISGENAPAGPMYNRDGTVRRAWYDPVGWAGLDKLPPPDQLLIQLKEQQLELVRRNELIAERMIQKNEELKRLGALNSAIQGRPYLKKQVLEQKERMAALSEELAQLGAQRETDLATHEALKEYEKKLLAGQRDPVRAHIRRMHRPASDSELRVNRLVEFWAAVSIGLLMVGFVLLILFTRQHIVLGLVILISVFVFLESGFRKQLPQLINSVAVGLAIVSLLVLLYNFFWQIVILGVFFAGVYIMWENLKEFSKR
jgi:hypothetical protein